MMQVKFGSYIHIYGTSAEAVTRKLKEVADKNPISCLNTPSPIEGTDRFYGRALTGKQAKDVFRFFGIRFPKGVTEAQADKIVETGLAAKFGDLRTGIGHLSTLMFQSWRILEPVSKDVLHLNADTGKASRKAPEGGYTSPKAATGAGTCCP